LPETRRTFNPVSADVCWQKQLRDRFEADPRPTRDLPLSSSIVRPVSRALASQIILKYEWLGTMTRTVEHYGLFWGSWCAGVTCFGFNVVGGTSVPAMFKLAHDEVIFLARGACVHWAPSGANSRLVSLSCRLLARRSRAKLVVAYSDVDAGEIGTIYQACNWVYIGAGASTQQWVTPSGRRVFDAKLAGNIVYTWRRKLHPDAQRADVVERLRAAGWTQQHSSRKHRYVYVLDRRDRALVARIEQMSRPYPKRERSIVSDALGSQPREGGANTTRSLHDTSP